MKGMDKQERMEQLLSHDDATWHWRCRGLCFNLIAVISYQTLIYIRLIVFALLGDMLGWFGIEAIRFTWQTSVGIVLIPVGGCCSS